MVGSEIDPKGGKLVHQPSGKIFYPAVCCRTLKERFLGIRQGRCQPYGIPDFWVHTFGLKFPIDAVFCDANGKVLKVMTLPPNRISPPVWGTKLVWESVTPMLSHDVKIGDTLRWETAILWNAARGYGMEERWDDTKRRLDEAIAQRELEEAISSRVARGQEGRDSCG